MLSGVIWHRPGAKWWARVNTVRTLVSNRQVGKQSASPRALCSTSLLSYCNNGDDKTIDTG